MHFVNDGLAAYLPGILPYLVVARHVPLPLASALMTILLVGQALQPVAGMWADRIGGRSLIIAGPVLGAAATAALAFAPSYAAFAVALFLIGAGSTIYHPQALSAARTLSARREGAGMSAFLIGGELGRALGPLAASALVVRFGLSHLWWLGVPVALTWPWLWGRLPRLPARRAGGAPVAWGRHRGPIAALAAFGALRAAAMYGISTFVPLLWQQRGGSLLAGAGMVTVLLGVGIAGNLGGGLVADRWGRRPVLYGSAALTVVTLVWFLLARGPWLWPALGATGIALFATLPVTTLAGQDIFRENPGLGSGIAIGFGNGVGALLLLPLGLAAAHWGTASPLWILAGAMLCSLPWVGALAPRHRDGA
jgi:FSR family fosmidomycin resistance protein-like MFS transporter